MWNIFAYIIQTTIYAILPIACTAYVLMKNRLPALLAWPIFAASFLKALVPIVMTVTLLLNGLTFGHIHSLTSPI